jgi:FixJ family two-component response regulator/DNA-binding MarR family transcriptional regulator
MTEEVLLLDDDLTTLTFLEGVLTGAGFKCSLSGDPQQALATVAAREEIAVVVSDLYMPHMSGLQFADALTTLGLNRPVPRVLLLTARPSVESAVGALRSGALDFLTKPVRPAEIIDTVGRAMERARQDRRAFLASAPDVVQLIRHAEELTGELRRLAEPATRNALAGARQNDPSRESFQNLAPLHTPLQASLQSGQRTKVSVLDTIEQLRRVRNRYNSHKLDEVAWELLLELLRAEQSNQKLSVSALTISIPGVSATTSLRRIGELATGGYVDRTPDARDGRRDFVTLTVKARGLLTDYLANVDSCLTDLLSNDTPVSASARSGG